VRPPSGVSLPEAQDDPADDVGGSADEVPFDAAHPELAEEAKSLGQLYPAAAGKRERWALPHTGLRLNVSSKYFLRPSAVDDGRGVVPDIHAPRAGTPALADDPAIERILSSVGPTCLELRSPRPGT